MEPPEQSPEQPEQNQDPVTAIQNVLSDIGADSMAIGFACIVEWLEPDGSTSIEVIHTDMPPWHMQGLFSWVTNMTSSYYISSDERGLVDDDDDF